MTRRSIRLLAATVVLSLTPIGVPVAAGAGPAHTIDQKGQAKGQDKAKGRPARAKGDTTRVVVVDRNGHHRVIREYVTRGSLPPGLAKRRLLPPGLARQLREDGELPPGLQAYFTPVPQEIQVRFPALPEHYRRYFAGNHFVVVDTRSNRIALLIRDLLQ